MRILFSLFLLLSVVSCSKKNSTKIDELSVIIHEHEYYSKEFKTYTPTMQDISKGLGLLGAEIDNSERLHGIPSDVLNHVYKQYFGYYEQGNQMLLINCLCMLHEFPDSIDHFREELIIPDDGGFCYFQGYIDMTNDTVWLSVNGPD